MGVYLLLFILLFYSMLNFLKLSLPPPPPPTPFSWRVGSFYCHLKNLCKLKCVVFIFHLFHFNLFSLLFDCNNFVFHYGVICAYKMPEYM